MNRLVIDNVTKYYGKNIGIKNISLSLKKGEIFGFIGPNGAGKSTTIKCIMNLLNYDGEILFNGDVISNKTKSLIGYLPSDINLYKNLKVIDMLKYNDSFYEEDTITKSISLCERLKLDLNKKIEELSLGNLKKIGIVLALCHNPELLILDEATSGLDPLIQEEFFSILLEEKKKGTTIFFSSHNLSEVEKISDRVGIIKNGKIIKIEDIKDIRNRRLVNIYIKAKDIKKIILPVKNMIIKKSVGDELFFSYNGEINDILKCISKIDVDDLLISEPTLEELFMHYYKEV